MLLYPMILCQARVSLTMETEQKVKLFSGNNIFQKIETMCKDEQNKEGERSFKVNPSFSSSDNRQLWK